MVGRLNPSGRGGADLRTSTDAYEGSTAALIESNGKKGKLIQGVVGLDVTKSYVYSCYIKPNSTATEGVPFNLRGRHYDSAGDPVGMNIAENYVTQTQNDGYVRYGFPIRNNISYHELIVQIQLHQAGAENAGSYLIDNASLVEVNDFENMNFEEGVDYIWRKSLTGTSTVSNEKVDVYSGNNSAKLILSTNDDEITLKNQIRKSVEFGKSYTISAQAKALIDHANADSMKIVTKTYGADNLFIRNKGTKFDISDTFNEYSNSLIPTIDEKFIAFEIVVYNQSGTYIIDDVSITEGIANSTNNMELETISIYPNPVNEYINVKGFNSETVDIKVYDITGKFAFQKSSVRSGDEIDIQFLSNGMYVIEIISDQNTSVSKFIKK